MSIVDDGRSHIIGQDVMLGYHADTGLSQMSDLDIPLSLSWVKWMKL